jgi:integrase
MALNPNQVKSLQSGIYADGGGLYLVVRDTGDRAWAFRFTALDGKRAQMEFAKAVEKATGKADEKSLAEARDIARDFHVDLKRNGIDPRVKKRTASDNGISFKQFADSQYPNFCKGKNPEEEKQWKRAINDVPSLHDLKLNAVSTEDVLDALKPIWWEKPVSADRVRQRLERLFDAAKALKLRTGDNPFAWRGNLKYLLPPVRGKNGIHKKKHYASIGYAKAPALMKALGYDTGNAARCVEVGILTVTRSKEVRSMEWDEIDLKEKQWLIPATKMKIKQGSDNTARDHLVPLSDQALEIIKQMPRVGRYVFPTDDPQTKDHQPFFANALVGAIKRAGFDATMHGMRSTFRNWGGDSREHNFRREVLEFCLAHRVGDEAELSYWTSEMLERRREVLQAWADYVIKPHQPKATKKKPSLKLVA